MHTALRFLVPAIAVLALAAALAGLWPAQGAPYPAVTLRGEPVTVNARGLYYWDTVSMAAQMKANDLVTIVLAIPALAASFVLALRGSLRARIVLAGTVGFFLYTYMSMCFGAQFNPFFPAYVALFGMSLYAMVLVLASFDLPALPDRFSARLPRRGIAALLFFVAAFLALAWSGRIAAAYAPGAVPLLENATSMFIQAMDLSIIVPLCVVAGVLLLRRRPWGYLLASVGLIKFTTLGVAVSLMGANMARSGVSVSPVELAVFPVITLVGIVMTAAQLANVREENKPTVR